MLDTLGRDICSGRIRPGQLLLPEPELCARFGFSRIVIREAVKSLAAKGLLAVTRRVGTLVLEPTRWNLFDTDIIGWRAASAVADPVLQRDLMEMRRILSGWEGLAEEFGADPRDIAYMAPLFEENL